MEFCFQERNQLYFEEKLIATCFLGVLSMEGTALSSSGVTVAGSDAPRTTTENPTQATGSSPTNVTVTAARGVGSVTTLKKKRGRPRKYGTDGTVATALSRKPISSSAPPSVIDFSAVEKRGKVRSVGSAAKFLQPRMEDDSMGNGMIILYISVHARQVLLHACPSNFVFILICLILFSLSEFDN